MGPIQNNKPITPPAIPTDAAAPVAGPSGPVKTGPDFAIHPTAVQASGPVSTAPQSPANLSLPSLRGHIEAALKGTTNPDAVVKTVVERRVDEQFGNLATPQMKASVVAQLSSDPHFVSTIHRLVREVSATAADLDAGRSQP